MAGEFAGKCRGKTAGAWDAHSLLKSDTLRRDPGSQGVMFAGGGDHVVDFA